MVFIEPSFRLRGFRSVAPGAPAPDYSVDLTCPATASSRDHLMMSRELCSLLGISSLAGLEQ